MPVVGIPIAQLRDLIGNNLSNEKIVQCCQEIGCDVEEFTRLNRVKCLQCMNTIEYTQTEAMPKVCETCHHDLQKKDADFEVLPPAEVIRLDLLADRPDNFDAGGLSRSIRGYLGFESGLAVYRLSASDYRVTVDPSTQAKTSYRPCITCAVVKNVHFTDETLKNVMKLQENLHWALGRDRKFASIGVYNLDCVTKNIAYTTAPKNGFWFVPLGSPGLGEEYKMSPQEILEKHPKGVAYAHLLKDFDRYPLLQDDKGTVLSMPPIINSEDTKVTIATTNLFIDVTGLRQDVINRVLNIMVTSVKETIPGCTLHSVSVSCPGGETLTTPDLGPVDFTAAFGHCREVIGIDSNDDEIVRLLKNMRYGAEKNGAACAIKIPAYRSDIVHEYDIIEDVAIAYGFKNIRPRAITSYSIGAMLPVQIKQQLVREIMTGLGFWETINIMLTSEKRAYDNLGMPWCAERAVIENPISTEQTIFRTELISSLVETLAHNTNNELPHKIFEVGEIIFLDETMETGTREEIALGVTLAASRAGFADIKAIFQSVMRELNLAAKAEVEKTALPLYLEGRACCIMIDGKPAGHMGEIHPAVLERFHIYNPVVALEINLSRAGLI